MNTGIDRAAFKFYQIFSISIEFKLHQMAVSNLEILRLKLLKKLHLGYHHSTTVSNNFERSRIFTNRIFTSSKKLIKIIKLNHFISN